MIRRNRSHRLTLMVVALLAALSLIGATPPAGTSAAVVRASVELAPDATQLPLINYQGRLVSPTTGEPKPDGIYEAAFALYNADTAGTLLWTEGQNIVVSKGLFSVTLGTITPIDPAIFNGEGRWISVTIKPDTVELAPRIRVAHAPYAIWSNQALNAVNAANAANADRLGGSLPGAYAAAAHSHDTTSITSGNLSTDRYRAAEDLSAEGYLGNLAGDIALNNSVLQPTLNADLLDGQHSAAFAPSSHTHDATAITSGMLSTNVFSAYADLGADSRIGTLAGQVAAGDHVHNGATIVDATIGTADLADASVTSAKIADGNVANADLAASSVDSAKIVDLSVTASDLASGAVTTAKVSSTGAGARDVLQYDGTKVLWDYAPGSEIRFTVFEPNCVTLASVPSGAWTRIASLGTLSKIDATSRLEITFNGRINAQSFTGTGAQFELRLDDIATTNGRARASMKTSEAGGTGVSVSITGIFTGYGAGNHTISMWIYSYYGTATYAGTDPGCYYSDHIIVREIK